MERYLIPRKPALAFAFVFFCLIILHGTDVVTADTVVNTVPMFCPFQALTGIPCPGCGMTRAILSIVKGDFGSAFGYNPFAFFLLFMVVVSVMPKKQTERIFSGRVAVINYSLIAVLTAIVIFWFFSRFLPAFHLPLSNS